MKVGFVSLGCSKNLIDTEVAIGKFKEHNFEIVNDPYQAEIIVINTCGFIESAKEEAINTILEMAEYKNQNCKYLIAMGCLVQRYYDDLCKTLPEVDLFLKLDQYDNMWDKIEEMISRKEKEDKNNSNNKKAKKEILEDKLIRELPMFKQREYLERTVSTGANYAYLKIGEGCSNMCTYCAIPYIRGLFVSRPIEDILQEAKELADKGIKELIIIAQDTTKYGVDIYGESKLPKLLEELCKIDGVQWIRFLYAYPEGITDELIKVVKENQKICKYFDIPIQHISDDILKKMNRKTSRKNIENIISKIRNEIPDVTLRTSLIVGFPSESKEDFQQLYDFVEETKFDKLGVFKYSKEEGTPAAKMSNQVHYKVKESRYMKIMKLQQKISKEKMKEKLHKKIEILIEKKSHDGKFLIGRAKSDAPDIDGIAYIINTKRYKINKIVQCKVVDISEYDLIVE